MIGNTPVLIIEDDIITQKVLGHKLNASGFKVMYSRDGMDCLSLIKDHKIVVVVVDINLPYKQGEEIIDEILNANTSMTIYATSTKKRGLLSSGFLEKINGFIQKPYNMRSLNDFIDDISQITS